MSANNHETNIRGHRIFVDISREERLGIYGQTFWDSISNDLYEPPTFDFIERSSKLGHRYFIDIGSATGCMSFYAALCGMNVIAVEPQTQVFECLSRNIELNKDQLKNVKIYSALVVGASNQDKSNYFTEGASGPLSSISKKVTTLTIREITKELTLNDEPVFKIDIEGAEYNLLTDSDSVDRLKELRAVVFLSFHPGFIRPLRRGYGVTEKLFWILRTIWSTWIFIGFLRKHSIITTPGDVKKLGALQVLYKLSKDQKDFEVYFRD